MKKNQPTVTLEPPWYRCENGTEFRGLTSKPPEKCPICRSTKIEMVVDIAPELAQRKKESSGERTRTTNDN